MTGEPGAVLTDAERRLRSQVNDFIACGQGQVPVFTALQVMELLDQIAALTQDRDRYADEVLRWQVIAGEDAERLDETLAVVEAVRALILELNADADYRVPKRYLGDRLRALLPPTEPTAAHARTADWRVIGCTCGWSAPGEDYKAFDRHLADQAPSGEEA